MPLEAHLDLRYVPSSSHPRHTLDLYLPPSSPLGVIVFVHGGAWFTSSSRHETLDAFPTSFPQDHALAIVNYRLSGQDDKLIHPEHVKDVVKATEWLVETGAEGLIDEAARKKIWLIGHSAGAHMIAHILLETPSLSPVSPALRSSIRGYLFSEGIFDIDDLILEFPDYAGWFLTTAFGPASPNYNMSSPSNSSSPFTLPSHLPSPPPKVLISQSPSDPLITSRQALAMQSRLLALGCPRVEYVGNRMGSKGGDGGHDELLKSVEFGELVDEFVRA